jgi:hypothetical protein
MPHPCRFLAARRASVRNRRSLSHFTTADKAKIFQPQWNFAITSRSLVVEIMPNAHPFSSPANALIHQPRILIQCFIHSLHWISHFTLNAALIFTFMLLSDWWKLLLISFLSRYWRWCNTTIGFCLRHTLLVSLRTTTNSINY